LAPGEICKECGRFEPPIKDFDLTKNSNDMTDEQMAKELCTRLKSINTRKISEAEVMKIVQNYIEEKNIRIITESYVRNVGPDFQFDSEQTTDAPCDPYEKEKIESKSKATEIIKNITAPVNKTAIAEINPKKDPFTFVENPDEGKNV
jgi:hypothetical protein